MGMHRFTHVDPQTIVVTDTTITSLSFGEILEGMLPERPAPVPPGTNTPGDLNHEGLYEDINSNSLLDFSDVVVFFNQMDWITENDPVSAFDFNKKSRIDFNDIVILYNEQ
ncbi:hypothetical protein [Methanosphaerula palustris]|uniref:Dockerin domain-containing protein n=1 Tax=Methanosphaerula palustris (strain ATCC BAA-1556 / DSM 19958 / E1-9c) TaxID=521011 RepID=B8GE77_METPE|nr:hypothetical protein [Methanosphaerula palustris]ACL17578.1 hypothetical protein Mpal_2292 [Methanosphaerula palustris E1-9c]